MFQAQKKPTAFLFFLVTVFSCSQLTFAEAIARPPVVPRPAPRPPAPVPRPPAPVPAPAPKPKPPAPAPVLPGKPGATGSPAPIDTKPATRLGGHAGGETPTGRELAPKKLSHEEVLTRIQSKALKEQVKSSPEALDGLAVREGLLDAALNGQRELTHKSAGSFEKALMEKLIGKDLSKMKEEDLKDLQSLVCGPMCAGHERAALSCRRTTRFMEALKSTKGILGASGALGVLFAAFVNAPTEKVDQSEGIVVANAEGALLKVRDLDKPVPQEKLVPESESSK